jgi:hypothetical protein
VQNFKISGKCDFTLQLQVIRKPILPPIVNLQNGNFYYMCKLWCRFEQNHNFNPQKCELLMRI